MSTKRSKKAILAVLVIVCVALIIGATVIAWKDKPSFAIGKDTTRVTEPVDAEGYIDYPAALNKQLREGVTPENNANVLLLQAYGPRPEGAPLNPEYYEALGIAPLPESGNYFVKVSNYAREQLNLDTESVSRIEDQLSVARSRPWEASTFPEIAEWLQANEKPLALVIEASKRSAYYNPLFPTVDAAGRNTLTSCVLPTMHNGRNVVAALTARAMQRLQAGQTDAAWDDLLASHRLARHLGGGGTLIDALVGFAVERMAASADLEFLQHAQVDSRRLEACLRDLDALRPTRPMSERFDVGERFMALDMMTMLDRRGANALRDILGRGSSDSDRMERFLYSTAVWEPALRNANHWFDRIVAAAEIKDPLERRANLAAIESELADLKNGKFGFIRVLVSGSAKGEFVGQILMGLLLPSMCKVQDAADRHEQTMQNLRVAFALSAYRRDHGSYPANLEELTPKYLKTLPSDLFSAKPLVYRPSSDGYLLYSVGPNGKDDDGQGSTDTPRGDDLPVRIPTPQREKE